ncbi:Stk1 family PASTA domain-containing Ser/Thr kinase [Clostridioides difficile]|uniref:PASTA domain-containing Ser/Thr kinase PrkC n=1 Tax=Clostridioides difficile TaxID=1496 RepID=UPI00038C6E8C|nr:PASTA domain-containing Ser/Thr kinase PrkC [Clostridioides difficile]EGT2205490.1 Stk1 family PASTA domain-containing Ser/Thr kinase [Clostridioides difficile]EGT3956114.1 Stk1 family PASTA domain-containing Ser/Thr kinase [Clostridioides difficile]EGT4053063.1 Stk1 family PASTA domain-containing Ser/Thr kinase [Clostridioides difficile]EGT4824881.1 Stk1 family PASTA domain-containing Ser/Thr kinase [Clostridioides difficile]EGT5246404.1 Stk1 family PASTA domain-containing Ser/Thr kinase [
MGDTILGNRYEIIRKIGDGGMAFVYEAKDRLLNRTVALKVLRPEFVDDDEFLTKFKREAEAVASLSHPNIVNVYDVGEDGKVHYIVMEFVDGKNLKEIIQDEGILDEYTALDITKQIAMALSAAHKKGIIHRDIKPHNILISNEGRVVKVADFGIAKAVSNSTMTNIGSIIGSVHYFSPEQAKGKFVTNNADLYSLGIVLYEMLIGKVPFRGDSPISIALQHINDDIDFTSEEKVRIPQSVRTTIKKLTEKSSADRYQTAEELIEDIEYIEKNIDLDFIKEYDDFATKKIDEKEINKVVNPTLAKPAPEKVVKPVEVADLDDDEDYYDDFYEEDEEEEEEEEIMRAKKNQRPKSTPSKRTKKKKKKQESPKSRRRLKVIAAVLILILCAQVFLAYKFLFAGGFGNKSLTVPNLVNMTLEEAQSAVEKEGLYLSVKSEEYNSEVDENCIISQTPEGGSTNVKKGDTINVVVSKGSSQASVPNVVGLTLSNAKQLIEENNLKVGTVKYEYSSIYKEGTVLSQSPGAGSSRAQEGDEVNLYVSKGSEKSNTQTPTVPDKKPTTPENNTPTEPGSNSGNSGGNSGSSNSGNSGGNSGNNGGNSGGSNSGNSGGSSGGSNSGDNGGSSGGSNSGDNGGSSGGSNSGDNGDSSGGSNSGDNGGTSPGTGANIGKTE